MAIDFSTITANSQVPIPSTTSTTSSTGSATSSSTDAVGSQDYFLKLLVAQMNNQDPLNPMDSAAMTSQLAELNTVQGIQKMSTQLDSLLGDVSTSQTYQASSLVGRAVLVPGTSLALADGQAVGGVNLAADADDVTLTIKDSTGTVVKTEDMGKQSAGIVNFVWDGSTTSGAAAAAGSYTFSVAATTAGTKVDASTLSAGTLESVTPGTSGAQVFVSGVGNVQLSQIAQIF
jgi:flagellar basal-body rod modification protein FlgD